MTAFAGEVRAFVLEQVRDRLREAGLDPREITDETDLLGQGVLDSVDVLELMTVVGDHFGIEDWEELDPEQILFIGPFCRYIESKRSAPAAAQDD